MTTELTPQEVEDRLHRAFQARAEDMAPGDGGEWNADEAGSVVVALGDRGAGSPSRPWPRLAVAAVAAGSLALAGVATAAFLSTGTDGPRTGTDAPRTEVLPAAALGQPLPEDDDYGNWDVSTPEGVMDLAEQVKEFGHLEQHVALRDGVVTNGEYQESIDNAIACQEAAGIEVIRGGDSYSIVVTDEAQMADAERCHFGYEAYVQTAYFAANPPPDWQESEELSECLGELLLDPPPDWTETDQAQACFEQVLAN